PGVQIYLLQEFYPQEWTAQKKTNNQAIPFKKKNANAPMPRRSIHVLLGFSCFIIPETLREKVSRHIYSSHLPLLQLVHGYFYQNHIDLTPRQILRTSFRCLLHILGKMKMHE